MRKAGRPGGDGGSDYSIIAAMRRGATLRDAVQRHDLSPRTLMRVERRIRAWMARHRPHGR